MFKTLLRFLVLMSFVTSTMAQFVPLDPTTAGTAPKNTSPSWIMPPGKMYIDTSSLPHKRYGFDTARDGVVCIGVNSDNPTAGQCNSALVGYFNQTFTDGSFRITCDTSHFAFDDPIVWPGQPGMTHLHVFFANDTTASGSDLNNLRTRGTSTCHGGLRNLSGYWVPPLVYHCPNPTISGCDGTRNGKVLMPYTNEAYYKTGGNPWDLASMIWPPQGFRMIGGNSTSTTIQLRHFFACNNNSNSNPSASHGTSGATSQFGARMPVSSEAAYLDQCSAINMFVAFPQCWDGVNLDSPDHKSHIVEIESNPAIHPGRPTCTQAGYTSAEGGKLLPSISYNVHYHISVPDLDYLRLSSDLPETVNTTQSSADATHITLAASSPTQTDYYKFGMIFIGGVGRQVCGYDGTSKVAIMCVAFPTTPAPGTTYAARNPGGITTHGDWVMGWDDVNPADPAVPSSLTVTEAIKQKCWLVRADCNDSDLGDLDPTNDRTSTPTAPHWYILN